MTRTKPAVKTPADTGLDPLRFPLRGQRLIEASAGTGKTFTLALLYTRLVLGHGLDDCAFERALVPPEILVVTFTDAATKELRARIRARLVQAADWFAAEGPPGDDALLEQLRADYPPEHWPACARRLRQGADWMDEAMIVTIHGFCQRMLKEHAFATRGLFERALVSDSSELLDETLRDYWRVHFYPLPAELVAVLQESIPSPVVLKAKLSDWIKHSDARLSHAGQPVPIEDPRAALQATFEQRQREAATQLWEDQARAHWRQDRARVEELLWELRPHLNGNKHHSANPEKFQALLSQLAAWSAGDQAPKLLVNFAQNAFQFKKAAHIHQAPPHPAFQAIAAWQAEVDRVQQTSVAPDPPLEPRLLAHAADWLGRELPRRLSQRAEMGFDDLLRDLDAALHPADPAQQPQADHLAATLRTQFPVALIDEFQDTDPLQYRIFARIYPGTAASSLILIGDPKQAIYGFRGADIQAYLAARQRARDRLHTLNINYRSTQALVDACNTFFEHAEQHDAGAFRFGSKEAAEDNPVPYVRVSAAGQADQLIIDHQSAPAMTLWWLDGAEGQPLGSVAYRDAMADTAASEIVRWLEQARDDRTGFATETTWQALRPRDIAILVRSGTEATNMRQALAERGVKSVYLSDRDSIFATPEAADMHHWLKACAQPHDEDLVRAALGTNTLALPLEVFDQWQRDELAWEAQLERFRGYRHLWQRQGVLAALRRLMHDHELPARLLAQFDGERALTNLLHLAEWLQRAASVLDGEQALIRRLSEQLGQDAAQEENILRLESDAELVRVITIHKAKGLEYPLVLLPFICDWHTIDGHVARVLYRPQAAQGVLERSIELAGHRVFPEAWQQADDERLSEDIRLLYVAVTRARHALWLGVAPLTKTTSKKPQLERSAFGYILNGTHGFPTNDAVYQRLLELTQGCAAITLQPAPEPNRRRLVEDVAQACEPARRPQHSRFTPWWISSYSALRLNRLHQRADQTFTPGAESAREETALETATLNEMRQVSAPNPSDLNDPGQRSLHQFPRGTRAGTFLHGVLEWAGCADLQIGPDGERQQGFAAAAAGSVQRRDMLARRCALRGLEHWIDPLNDWLNTVLSRAWSLPGERSSPLILAQLPWAQTRIEMEFWIEARSVDIGRLDALVRQQCLPAAPRPPLRAGQLNGMLKGFIDLVFEHQGRFYVLDWKSNWLGPRDGDYTEVAMRRAILYHRYDLQYLFYLFALHRLLRARRADYDCDRHLGGALYVFLRGVDAPSQGLFVDRPPCALLEALDDCFAGAQK